MSTEFSYAVKNSKYEFDLIPIVKIFNHSAPLFYEHENFKNLNSFLIYMIENRDQIKIFNDKMLEFDIMDFISIVTSEIAKSRNLNLLTFSGHNIYLDEDGCSWMKGNL